MGRKSKEKYYVFRARCIVNSDGYGELMFLERDELYRRFSKENPAFLFEFSNEKFNLDDFTEHLKYPLYATQQFVFFQVFFVLYVSQDYKNMKIVFFDHKVRNWISTDLTDEYFLYWNDFSDDEFNKFDEMSERFSLFADNFSNSTRTQKTLEKEYLSNVL